MTKYQRSKKERLKARGGPIRRYPVVVDPGKDASPELITRIKEGMQKQMDELTSQVLSIGPISINGPYEYFTPEAIRSMLATMPNDVQYAYSEGSLIGKSVVEWRDVMHAEELIEEVDLNVGFRSMVFMLINPLLHDKGYELYHSTQPDGLRTQKWDENGYAIEYMHMRNVWRLQSKGGNGNSPLDLIFESDAELFVFLVTLLFPERALDYIKIAMDMSKNPKHQEYFCDEIKRRTDQ